MNIRQIIGIICVAVGIYLIVSANQSMESTGQKIKQEFTGTYSESVRINLIGGIILVVAGSGLLIFSRGKP
jgi:uncharacterized membrane protein YidH (DUF202 family)